MSSARERLEGTPYLLDRVIGAGAMGEVWLGEHASLRRPAVIKLIHPRFVAEAHVVARMRREARIVANLRHDALVTVYDLGETADGRTYIAMEWLDGAVLREVMRSRGALPPAEACGLAIQMLEGLHAAHVAGVIHRDVKPENLFVTREGKLKVLDFGVAKPMQEGDMTGARTAAGVVLGTPRYMAPEQAVGRALSAATDVYAVGCVLFELCTGRPAFEGTDARELLYAHVHTPATSMSSRCCRAFDPQLEAIVARALVKDASRRFATAAEMADALRAIAQPRPSAAPPSHGNDAFKATVPMDLSAVAAAAVPTSMGEPATRVMSAQHLVVGTDTTLHAPPTVPQPSRAHESTTSAYAHTQPTEVLEAQHGATAGSQITYDPISNTLGGADDSTIDATTRRTSPTRGLALVVLGAAFGAAAAVGGVYLATRDRTADHAEVAVASSAPATRASIEEHAEEIAPSAEPIGTASAVETTTARAPVARASEPAPVAKSAPTPTATTSATTTAIASASAAPSPSVTATATAPTPPSHVELARQAMNDGDLDLAEREARLAGPSSGARLLLGEILERRGKTALARDVYKQILAADPDNGTAKTRLARLGG